MQRIQEFQQPATSQLLASSSIRAPHPHTPAPPPPPPPPAALPCSHVVAEGELADGAPLVVIPDHDFVGGVARVGAAAHQRQDVAAEEHLDDGHAAAGAELAAKLRAGGGRAGGRGGGEEGAGGSMGAASMAAIVCRAMPGLLSCHGGPEM